MLPDASTRLEQVLQSQKQTAYYNKFERTEHAIRQRVDRMKLIAANLTSTDYSIAQYHTNEITTQLEKSCILNRVICVVDFDQFFAAVEMRDNPELKNVPLAVGMSLVSTANYEARKYGVRSAMPTFIAKQLCPHLVCVPGNYAAYGEVATQAREIFMEYDPEFVSHSLDEAYLDLSGKLGSGNDLSTEAGILAADKMVNELRQRLKIKTGGLTVSAGIAPNSMLAKVATDIRKPDGQYLVRVDSMVDFVRSLKVRKIPGIGKAQEVFLDGLQITTVQDMWDKRLVLNRICSKLQFEFYMRVALGLATESETIPFAPGNALLNDDPKSISIERTFGGTSDETYLFNKLKELCDTLSQQIREKENLYGRVLSLKYKTVDFDTHTKTITLAKRIGGPTCHAHDMLYELEILLRAIFPIKLRLMGVRLSGLEVVEGSNNNNNNNVGEMNEVASETSHLVNNNNITTTSDASRQTLLDKYLPPPLFSTNTTSTTMSNKSNTNTLPVTCPICGKVITVQDNKELNTHIDACLNRDVVKELLVEQQFAKKNDVIDSSNTSNSSSSSTNNRTMDKYVYKMDRRL
jgi:DNA polymerase kappa